jgi:hypothetical protein
MNTYFVYYACPKFPRDVTRFLSNNTAEQFGIGFVIKTDENIPVVFTRLWQWVLGQGFLYMVDAARPEKEYSYPPKGRLQFLRDNTELSALVQTFLDKYSKSQNSFPLD